MNNIVELPQQAVLLISGSFFSEKTKNLLFNGAKAVMGKIWTGEERSTDQQPTGQVETRACQALLRGQTLIGCDGRLMRANTAQGEPGLISKRTKSCSL